MFSVLRKFLNLSSFQVKLREFRCCKCAPRLIKQGWSSQVAEMSHLGRESWPATHTAEPGLLYRVSEPRSSSQSQLVRLKYLFHWSPPDSWLEADLYKHGNVPGEAAIQGILPNTSTRWGIFFLVTKTSVSLICFVSLNLINLGHL